MIEPEFNLHRQLESVCRDNADYEHHLQVVKHKNINMEVDAHHFGGKRARSSPVYSQFIELEAEEENDMNSDGSDDSEDHDEAGGRGNQCYRRSDGHGQGNGDGQAAGIGRDGNIPGGDCDHRRDEVDHSDAGCQGEDIGQNGNGKGGQNDGDRQGVGCDSRDDSGDSDQASSVGLVGSKGLGEDFNGGACVSRGGIENHENEDTHGDAGDTTDSDENMRISQQRVTRRQAAGQNINILPTEAVGSASGFGFRSGDSGSDAFLTVRDVSWFGERQKGVFTTTTIQPRQRLTAYSGVLRWVTLDKDQLTAEATSHMVGLITVNHNSEVSAAQRWTRTRTLTHTHTHTRARIRTRARAYNVSTHAQEREKSRSQ